MQISDYLDQKSILMLAAALLLILLAVAGRFFIKRRQIAKADAKRRQTLKKY